MKSFKYFLLFFLLFIITALLIVIFAGERDIEIESLSEQLVPTAEYLLERPRSSEYFRTSLSDNPTITSDEEICVVILTLDAPTPIRLSNNELQRSTRITINNQNLPRNQLNYAVLSEPIFCLTPSLDAGLYILGIEIEDIASHQWAFQVTE